MDCGDFESRSHPHQEISRLCREYFFAPVALPVGFRANASERCVRYSPDWIISWAGGIWHDAFSTFDWEEQCHATETELEANLDWRDGGNAIAAVTRNPGSCADSGAGQAARCAATGSEAASAEATGSCSQAGYSSRSKAGHSACNHARYCSCREARYRAGSSAGQTRDSARCRGSSGARGQAADWGHQAAHWRQAAGCSSRRSE
jgi:hypothetical protein